MGLCMKWETHMAGPSDNARNHSYKKSDDWEDGDGRMASSQQTIISCPLPGGQKLVGPPAFCGKSKWLGPKHLASSI